LDTDLVNLAKALVADGQFRLANITIKRLVKINSQYSDLMNKNFIFEIYKRPQTIFILD